MSRWMAWLLALVFMVPVGYVLIVILSAPGDEYKEFVYVGGKEIERLDLYVLIPALFRASTPFLVLLATYLTVREIRRRFHQNDTKSAAE